MLERDTKSTEHKHTLSAQHRLIITDTERLVTALVVGPQDACSPTQNTSYHSTL